uniref:uncharacterized protein C10orf120 homolog n=1 Tax=Jaculus jaculus TaxID=51337 RepID=UPI001E1B371B|nr:uncharacterized protein C10orf120 homolog [Jaculus jaculus]
MTEGNGCQRTGSQRAGNAWAPKRLTAERESSSKKPTRILSTSHPFLNRDFPHDKESSCHTSTLGVWTRFYKSDPRIALGKYSPMEKKILHLGGIHTTAARRFLAGKFSEEWKMLRELQLQSSDYKKVTKDKKFPTYPCVLCERPEKLWTAKVVVPAEEFKMPLREKVDISKHVTRMQLARTRRLQPQELRTGRLRRTEPGLGPGGKDKAKEEGDSQSGDISVATNLEQGEEAEHATTDSQEIAMDVIFKAEEPPRCLLRHRNDLKPFLPVKKQERTITGLTNRNILPVAEFPGDLMLMRQHFISRGLHPSDAIRTYWLPEKNTCQVLTYPPPNLY